MDKPEAIEEINSDTPDNPTESDQNLTDKVEDRQKAMKATNNNVTNHLPPPTEVPADNRGDHPQRQLG